MPVVFGIRFWEALAYCGRKMVGLPYFAQIL